MGWMLSDALVIGATWLFVSAVVSAVTLQLLREAVLCAANQAHTNTFDPALSFTAWIITGQQFLVPGSAIEA